MKLISNKLDEFAFYAGELLNPFSGSKKSYLFLAAANIAVIGYSLKYGYSQYSPFAFFVGGLLTKRVACSAYTWARKYHADNLRNGWKQSDRQICMIGNGLSAIGSLDAVTQIGQSVWNNPPTLNMTAPELCAFTVVLGLGLLFGRNVVRNTGKNINLMNEMGGIRNFLSYRSSRALDPSNG